MKIAKTASLPLNKIKGDIKARGKLSRELTKEIFNEIVKDPQDLSLVRLQQIAQDTLSKAAGDGRRINIQIKGFNENIEIGGVENVIKNKDTITGFEIEIPAIKGKLIPEYLSHFMHEISHVTQQLTTPKILAKLDGGNLTSAQQKRVENLYGNTFYIQEFIDWFNPISAKLKQMIALRGLDDKQKIAVLQEMRQNLNSEFLSYLEEERFHCRARKFGITTKRPIDFDGIMFFEKFEYLEKEIAKLIKKVRKQHQA